MYDGDNWVSILLIRTFDYFVKQAPQNLVSGFKITRYARWRQQRASVEEKCLKFSHLFVLPVIVLIKELLLHEVSLYWLTVGRVDGGLAFGIKVRIAFHVTITNPYSACLF